MDRPVPQTSIKDQRDRTVAQLCEAFAQDRLEVAELEARLDLAHRAVTAADLDALVADLPAPVSPPAAPESDVLARSGRALREAVRDSRTFVAFMGGVERRGNWTPARKNVIIAVMGGAELDFREVDLPAGETDIFIFAMMGGAEIIVPPEMIVDASGIAIMGGFAHASAPRSPSADRPILRISGFCLMGGVDISVRHPGETPKDARLRQREEQRRLRGKG